MTDEQAHLSSDMPDVEGLDWANPENALLALGRYIDTCFRNGNRAGTDRALNIIQRINTADWSPELQGELHYMESNIQSDLYKELSGSNRDSGAWENPNLEAQILSLRKALLAAREARVPPPWLPMAFTNAGNVMDQLGRPVEAIELWNQALRIDPDHAMARGNRGMGFFKYASGIYDDGHRTLFLAAAYRDISEALKHPDRLEPEATETFPRYLEAVRNYFRSKSPFETLNVKEFSLGNSAEEQKYRRWCLDRNLFLNPLNDIDTWSIASHDVLGLPSVTAGDFQPQEWIALYNQLKQEFASARILMYEGFTSTGVHFADRGVRLVNTLDYPVYSLASEKVKVALRMSYSLFDKLAFFLNDYFGLAVPEREVSFKRIWYADAKGRNQLRHEFEGRQNWPLRGLFWLSKDLYEEGTGFQTATLPDARDLAETRHHAEHKLLRLHDPVVGASLATPVWPRPVRRRLGYSLGYDEFKKRALRLMKMARAGIVYLSMSVGAEERANARRDANSTPALRMALDIWEDEWKRPPS